MRRRWVLIGAAVAAVVVAAVVANPFGTEAAPSAADDPSAVPVETTEVTRRDLTTDKEFQATVTFGESWVLHTDATGVVTGSHDEGEVVGYGEELIRIDDKPVVLARGDMPMYRELAKVDTSSRDDAGNRRKRQTGDDVAQLQRFLLDAGFDANGRLAADGTFGGVTESALKDWQKAVGLGVTGKVDSAQIVFAPQPVRIASADRVGDAFSELEVDPTDAEVQVDTNTRDRGFLPEGASVVVRLPDTDDALDGVVASQQETQDDSGSTVWRTTIVTDPAIDPALTATSATVEVTRVVAEDVLTVPVAALLALAEGGYAVETVGGDGATTLVGVEVGEVADGIAEIDGNIAEGDEVVVPG
ncbi:MAG: hypothetical protein GEU81_08675 [Nitriliruptorales bacterium]|nr:hypothetical protein [Nitriliruptorales bacterium]